VCLDKYSEVIPKNVTTHGQLADLFNSITPTHHSDYRQTP